MKSKNLPVVGWLLIGIGVVHNALGVAAGWPLLVAAASDGLVGAWGAPGRGGVYWFLVTGFALMLTGGAVASLERYEPRLPWAWIAGLAALTLAGVVTLPRSGFWTLLVPLTVAVVRRLRTRAPTR
ncbi:MAG: DUF6463 family protein [Actinomycetia bacterium]|nr:DUF6463 family protein [Actinomycetes bacterium]